MRIHKQSPTPKPRRLIQRIIQIGSKPDSIILDSFAGSGTTAHAVLAENARDGGKRRFILVESEVYADEITAERVRRVVKGYKTEERTSEELLKVRLNFDVLLDPSRVLNEVAEIRPILVYAAAKFMSQKTLSKLGITFCQLPYSIHRILGDAPDEA